MTIKNKQLFGLEAVSDEALEQAAESSSETIPMYWGTSRETRFANGITLIRETFPHGWDSDGKATENERTAISLSFDVSTEMPLIPWSCIKPEYYYAPGMIMMRPLTPEREFGHPLPVNPVHPWLSRSIHLRQQEFNYKLFLAAETIRLDQATSFDDQTAFVHAAPGFLPLNELIGENAPEEAKRKVRFEGEIVESRVIGPIRFSDHGEDIASEPLRLFICRTEFGNVSVLARESLLSDSSRALVNSPGIILDAEGTLFADARAGRYESGAIWDTEHACTHLYNLAAIKGIKILSERLSRSSELFIDGQPEALGIESVINALRPLVYDFIMSYARIRDLKNDRVLPALLCRDVTRKEFRHLIIPEWNAESATFDRFRIETVAEEFEILFETHDFVRFINPDEPELRPLEKKPKAQEPVTPKYEFTGDPDCFPDKHDEKSNGFLAAIVETDNGYKKFVEESLASGSVRENTNRTIDGIKFVTFDCPVNPNEPAITGILSSPGDKTWTLINIMPRLPGLAAEAEVQGTCRWEMLVLGEVALSLGHASVTAVVPNFDLVKHLMQPGTKRYFRLSATVEDLAVREPTPIIVNEGPLYEMELESFLKENPGKTASDFEPVEISTVGMQMLFPRDYSTIFELASPVLSVKHTKLCDRDIVRLEVILHRWEDEEIRTYLYGTPSQIPEGVKEGSEVHGLIRLYAEPIAETFN